MFLEVLAEDNDIVKVDHQALSKEFLEGLVHQGGEGGRVFSHTKVH